MIEGFKYLRENEEWKREDNIIHVTKTEETGLTGRTGRESSRGGRKQFGMKYADMDVSKCYNETNDISILT